MLAIRISTIPVNDDLMMSIFSSFHSLLREIQERERERNLCLKNSIILREKKCIDQTESKREGLFGFFCKRVNLFLKL